MKKSAKQELRAKTVEELRAEAEAVRGEMLKVRIATALEGKRMGIRTRARRRHIARINTLLRERELAAKAKAN